MSAFSRDGRGFAATSGDPRRDGESARPPPRDPVLAPNANHANGNGARRPTFGEEEPLFGEKRTRGVQWGRDVPSFGFCFGEPTGRPPAASTTDPARPVSFGTAASTTCPAQASSFGFGTDVPTATAWTTGPAQAFSFCGGTDVPTATAWTTGPRPPQASSFASGTVAPTADPDTASTSIDDAVASSVRSIGAAAQLLRSEMSSRGIVVSDGAALLECATQVVLHQHQLPRKRQDDDKENGASSSSSSKRKW